jgi:c-di-GMP-binding flagellar brake protein YcgR
MTDGKELVERRRHKRFQVPSFSAYAVLRRHWLPSPIMGDIIDISLGGLSFRYVASEKSSYRSSGIDILLTDGSFCLNKIRVNTISDFEITNEVPFSSITMRRRGVQFGEMTDDHKSALRYFIQSYTRADPEA